MDRTTLLATIANFTLGCEARRDRQGHLTVYMLPPGDGGGLFEVAGICERYDHDVVWTLRAMLKDGRFDDAEACARAYYISNTDCLLKWDVVFDRAVEAFLRDTVFHRGLGGCARIVQLALKLTDDGIVGAKTKAGLVAAQAHPENIRDFLLALRVACESYERAVAPPIGARAKFWPGLVNRWNKRLAFAQSLVAA